MKSNRCENLSARLRGYIDRGNVAGAVALVEHNDRTIFSESYGFANIADKAPMRDDSIFRIASMTKPITSAAALMLMEDGVFELNAPIAQWIPELAAPRVLSSPNAELTD